MINIGDALLRILVDTEGLNAALAKVDQDVKATFDKIANNSRAVGAAFLAIGAAGVKMSSNARQWNTSLAATAITMGKTTDQMRTWFSASPM